MRSVRRSLCVDLMAVVETYILPIPLIGNIPLDNCLQIKGAELTYLIRTISIIMIQFQASLIGISLAGKRNAIYGTIFTMS